jgi:transglutaminase-like putative cysteine protease
MRGPAGNLCDGAHRAPFLAGSNFTGSRTLRHTAFIFRRHDRLMQVRVGCEFRYRAPAPTPTIWQVRPRPEGPHYLLSHTWSTAPALPVSTYLDMYGNVCDRLSLVEGENLIRYDATVDVPSGVDEIGAGAPQHPIEDLPDEALVYLLPSRFCLSDLLHDQAWELFGAVEPGWARAQAVSDWVHGNVTFQAGASTPVTTAVDVWEKRVGVCRDFAQLGVTFCRSLNIPARYVFGYLPDIGVPPPEEPMDFCAWLEVYLGTGGGRSTPATTSPGPAGSSSAADATPWTWPW